MAKSKIDQWLEELESEAETVEIAASVTPAAAPAPAAQSEGVADLWKPQGLQTARKSLEELLVDQGAIDAGQLLQAKTVQQNSRGKKLSQILVEMGAESRKNCRSSCCALGRHAQPPL